MKQAFAPEELNQGSFGGEIVSHGLTDITVDAYEKTSCLSLPLGEAGSVSRASDNPRIAPNAPRGSRRVQGLLQQQKAGLEPVRRNELRSDKDHGLGRSNWKAKGGIARKNRDARSGVRLLTFTRCGRRSPDGSRETRVVIPASNCNGISAETPAVAACASGGSSPTGICSMSIIRGRRATNDKSSSGVEG